MMELMQEAEQAGITVEYCSLPLNESMTFQDDDGDFILRIKIQFSRCALRSWICDYNSNKIVQFIGQKFWYAA